MKSVSTRFFNVFGTRSRTSGTYGAVFEFSWSKDCWTTINNSRRWDSKRDFVYVTDVCEGMYLAAQSKFEGEIFNIGSGNPQSVNYLAELIGAPKVYIPKRPYEPDVTHADISKAKSEIGYDPKISFEEG